MKPFRCAPLLFALSLLMLAACGRHVQTDGQTYQNCVTSSKQVDAEIELRRDHEAALLKRLRSGDTDENKVAAIKAQILEEQDFEKRNGQFCRDLDGSLRAAHTQENIVELLSGGIGEVKNHQRISLGLVTALDPEAAQKETFALQMAQAIPTILKSECGLELKFTGSASELKVDTATRTKVDEAVQTLLNPKKPDHLPLVRIIDQLNNVVETLNPDLIAALGDAGESVAQWSLAHEYLKSLSASLAEIETHSEQYQKNPKTLPKYWPGQK